MTTPIRTTSSCPTRWRLASWVPAVTANPDGTVGYLPGTSSVLQELAEGETAEDSFTYVATDGTANSAPATVTVTVSGVERRPGCRA